MIETVSYPKEVSRAINCIWISYAFPILGLIVFFFFPEFKSQVTSKGLSLHTVGNIMIAVLLICGLVVRFILERLKKGKNWARRLCLSWGIFCGVKEIEGFINYSGSHTELAISLTFNLGSLVLGYYALYLLYTSPGKEWFKKKQMEV